MNTKVAELSAHKLPIDSSRVTHKLTGSTFDSQVFEQDKIGEAYPVSLVANTDSVQHVVIQPFGVSVDFDVVDWRSIREIFDLTVNLSVDTDMYADISQFHIV